MSRRMHPSGRPQQKKSSGARPQTFSIRRPLTDESADILYDILDDLLDKEQLPVSSIFQDREDMGVSYIEKGKMSRQLRTWASGFNTRGLVDGVTSAETMHRPIPVGLGRVSLMGTRRQVIVARLDHSQIVAEEFAFIERGLATANIPAAHKQAFRPHVALLRLPNENMEAKNKVAAAIQSVLPLEIMLGPMGVDPPLSK